MKIILGPSTPAGLRHRKAQLHPKLTAHRCTCHPRLRREAWGSTGRTESEEPCSVNPKKRKQVIPKLPLYGLSTPASTTEVPLAWEWASVPITPLSVKGRKCRPCLPHLAREVILPEHLDDRVSRRQYRQREGTSCPLEFGHARGPFSLQTWRARDLCSK